MSFQRKNYKLVFPEDSEFYGLEISMKRLSTGDMFAVTQLADLGDDIIQAKDSLDDLFLLVSSAIIKWNFEDEEGVPIEPVKGVPSRIETVAGGEKILVPATGLYSIDLDVILQIVNAWVDAATAVAPPLPTRSNSSDLSPEAFDRMVAQSESPESTPVPS